jgi:hypothetical protein
MVVAACGDANDLPTHKANVLAPMIGADDAPHAIAPAAPAKPGAPVNRADAVANDAYPAPHARPPLVASWGGPVMKSPKVVPVFFSNEDPQIKRQLEDFLQRVGSTEYWRAAVSEYGVGALSSAPTVALDESAQGTIDDSEIQALLAKKLNANDPAFPPADESLLVMLHYPEGVTITAGRDQSCTSFGGYHSNITLDAAHGNIHVAYAVMPRCASFGPLTGLDAITGPESHELVEAATDPFPMNNPGYADVDEEHFYWSRVLGGGENGDMCAQFPGVFTKFPEIPYVVQRSWSNKAALEGREPCVPAMPGSVYFNAAPRLEDDIDFNIGGQTITAKGVRVLPGQSKTIDVNLFSEGDTGGPWTVDVKEIGPLGGGRPNVVYELDRNQGRNGDKLRLTITTRSQKRRQSSAFLLISRQGRRQNLWVGLVGT